MLVLANEVSLHYGNHFVLQKRRAGFGRGSAREVLRKPIKHPLKEREVSVTLRHSAISSIIVYSKDSDDIKLYVVNNVEEVKPVDAKEKPYRVIKIIDENNELYEIDNKRIKGKVIYFVKYLFKPSLKIKKLLEGGE